MLPVPRCPESAPSQAPCTASPPQAWPPGKSPCLLADSGFPLCLTLPPASLGQQQSLRVQVSKAERLLGLSLIDSEGDSASQEPRRALQGPLTSVRRHAEGTRAADKHRHLHPPPASQSISAQADSPKEMDSPCCWVPATEATASPIANLPRTIANRPCATVHGARVSLAKGKSASCLHCFLTV